MTTRARNRCQFWMMNSSSTGGGFRLKNKKPHRRRRIRLGGGPAGGRGAIWRGTSAPVVAERVPHCSHQGENLLVADPIIHLVGILARGEYSLVPKDRKVLGDVALGSADDVDQVLDAGLLHAGKDAQDLEPQRVAHGLERA